MSVMARKPAVAGQFYESDEQRLREQIKKCFLHDLGPGALPEKEKGTRILAAISPHAGLMFSGMCAAHIYKAIAESQKPDLFLLLGPNHSGLGRTSLLSEDFETPMGTAKVDKGFAQMLMKNCQISDDSRAHDFEHSLEVQLPFLQFIYENFSFVPIVVSSQMYLDPLAKGIKKTIKESEKSVCIIVSSDFTHYGPNYGYTPFEGVKDKKLKQLDQDAIQRIISGDVNSFISFMQETGATICGYLPIILMLKAASFSKGELLSYYTSADVLGDGENSVSYAGLIFK